MYNADDAVARVDSYIVSVDRRGPPRRRAPLVRIESVERAAAIALAARAERDGDGDGRGGWRRRRARIRRSDGAAAAGAAGAVPAPSVRAERADRDEPMAEHLRDSRERRQAVPRREGRRRCSSTACPRTRARRCPAPVAFRDDKDVVAARPGAREGQGRGDGRRAPARRRRSGSSSTRRRRATATRRATAPS